MSLFFYGAVELKNDEKDVSYHLTKLSQTLNWNLVLGELHNEYTINELFAIPEDCSKDFLEFELKEGENNDVYTELYDDYDGDIMVKYYRKLAQELEISNVEELEFGALENVDKVYQARPFNLPVIQFVRKLFEYFPDRDFVICIDEGFENRFDCQEVVDNIVELLHHIWLTIAYGYNFPNLRLWFKSN